MARKLVEDRDDDRPLLILGAAGQLGEVSTVVLGRRWPCTAWTRADLDLADGSRVMARIRDLRPWAIVNCAGYNLVDEAEERQAVALDANAFAVRAVARAATEVKASLVHYSSDFVFDGQTTVPYREEDQPNPRSVYAATKLLGEWFAAEAPAHYVLRVESLFGGISRRKGSLDKMIEAIGAGTAVRAFTDRTVSPSYAWDVAAATAVLLEGRAPFGLYHCVNSGAATWFEVASEAKRQAASPSPIEPITMQDTPLRAVRPRYCALSNAKLRAAGVSMPGWEEALAREWHSRRAANGDRSSAPTGRT